MTRKIEVVLEQRGIRAVAELLDDEAPKTCQAVWEALPQSGPVYHAKWANNEIYTYGVVGSVRCLLETEPERNRTPESPWRPLGATARIGRLGFRYSLYRSVRCTRRADAVRG